MPPAVHPDTTIQNAFITTFGLLAAATIGAFLKFLVDNRAARTAERGAELAQKVAEQTQRKDDLSAQARMEELFTQKTKDFFAQYDHDIKELRETIATMKAEHAQQIEDLTAELRVALKKIVSRDQLISRIQERIKALENTPVMQKLTQEVDAIIAAERAAGE